MRLGVAIQLKDAIKVEHTCRWFCQEFPFSNDAINLFIASQSSGYDVGINLFIFIFF